VSGEGPWPARAATVEAMAWLILARVLVARVSFGRWRRWLGAPVAAQASDPRLQLDANLAQRRLARAVVRASGHLPGQSRCLAQAMALHWMLRRRRLGGVLHIGILHGEARGTLNDLHAWVTRLGEVLVGGDDTSHNALFAAANVEFRS
jgi:hypothetical protein